MIALLRGRVVEKHPNRVVVDVHGVGYDVQVPLSTFYDVGEPGGDVLLRVHTYVREDALQLFGFLTDLEKQLFERLLAVNGIGPKLAIAVLSGMPPADLLTAVQRADVASLTGIPGIGKKTAERMVLELRDRLAHLVIPGPAASAETATPLETLRSDLVSALENLGYHRPQAEKAVKAVTSDGVDSFEESLKAALKELMR